MFNMENINTDACIDLPRTTDYMFDEMMGASINPVSKVEHKRTIVQDQGIDRDPSTKYACTCFSGSHIVNELNAIEESFLSIAWETLWGEALQHGAGIGVGWYLQKAIDLMRELGYISGYSVVSSLDSIKNALYINQLIYTGTNKCDWSKTRETNIFTPGTSYWHAFCIVWYDDTTEMLTAKNSYWEDKYDQGYFYIPYSHIDKLFTMYAVVDAGNKDLILNHKANMDDKMIRLTVEKGIMNGTNMNANITRREMAIVIGRLITMLQSE